MDRVAILAKTQKKAREKIRKGGGWLQQPPLLLRERVKALLVIQPSSVVVEMTKQDRALED